VWWRRSKGAPYAPLTETDRADLRAAFAARDRLSLLEDAAG
jgi:hypothetical protein